MKIDSLYSELDKSNFFLGKISAVFKFESKIQVENISLLNHRRIQREHLVPNTINYYVVIDGINGLFIGQIFQAMVSGPNSIHNARGLRDDGKIFPELSVDVFGIFEDDKIVFSGFRTVGITDKVYIANEESISRLINSLEINRNLSGKKLNGIAKLSGFEDRKLNLDPNTIFNRHLMAVGTTNSGKSTSALSILDKLVESNRKILLIDPTGEYTNSFENQEIIKLKLAEDTILPIGELDLKQWSMIFQTNDGSQDTELMKAIKSLRYQSYMSKSDSADETYKGIFKKEGLTLVEVSSELEKVDSEKHNGDFCLQDLPLQIIEEAVTEGTRGNAGKYVVDGFRSGVNTWLSQKVSNILDNSNFEQFFSDDTSKNDLFEKIDEFLKTPSKSLYIDTSEIGVGDGIGAMIIDVIAKYIMKQDKNEINPFVMYIDEVHRYTQVSDDTNLGLVTIAREGRKKGVFLFLTTQNPKDVPSVLLGQVGSMVIHRLTQIEELRAIQNQVSENTMQQITKLNQGEAVLASINLLNDIPVHFNKSHRIHGNDTPLL